MSEPLREVESLKGIKEEALNQSYLSRRERVRRVREVLGSGIPVVVHECKTRFDGVAIEVPDKQFSSMVANRHSEIEVQGKFFCFCSCRCSS